MIDAKIEVNYPHENFKQINKSLEMKRDGQTISLWQHAVPPYMAYNQNFPAEADVVIVGGGITGVSTALRLQQSGKMCVLAEAQELGFGTTGGTTSHLNTLIDKPYYKIINDFGVDNAMNIAKVTSEAIDLIEKNVRENDIECGFDRKVAYLFSQNEEQTTELAKITEGTQQAGIDMDYTQALPIPVPFVKAARTGGQGQLHATQYLFGIANVFEKAGGRIIQNCRVEDVIHQNGETMVVTPAGKIKTNYVIYATHIPPGVNILHFRCAPYRSYAMAVKLNDNNYPDALVYDLYDPYHYYRTQAIGQSRYLIVGGEDHKSGHKKNTDFCFTKLEKHIRKYFDVSEIAFRWSSQFYESADGLPYIGHLPGNPENILVATGFGGNGITFGTVSSIVLSDIICKGFSEYQELFNPNRVKLFAGFENLVKEAADVAGILIGGRFKIRELEDAAGLKYGEAKVVKYDGKSIAIYKDETGKIFALHPSCPHVKCVVAWNNAEKSWDCPCHGSRFSVSGEMLTAPARKNLEVIDLSELE